MRRTLTTLLTAITALAAPMTTAYAAGSVTATMTQPGRVAPQLATDAAGNQSLLTVSLAKPGTPPAAYLSRKSPSGAWTPPVRVTPERSQLTARVAMSPNGWTAVAWGSGDCSSAAFVKLRTPTGQWLRPHRFAQLCTPVAAAVNRRGDVAVLAYGPYDANSTGHWSVGTRVAGRWHVSGSVPDYGSQAPTMGMDRRGRVAVAYSSAADRSGTGWALLRSLAPGGRWERVRRVPMRSDRVERAGVVVAPGGRITVAGCKVSAGWDSSAEGPRCTRIDVFTVQRWDAPFVHALGVPDAELGQLIADPRASHVAVTYLHWLAKDQSGDPTQSAYSVRDLSWAAPVQVEQAASTFDTASVIAAAAVGTDGTAVVEWARADRTTPGWGSIHVDRVTGAGITDAAVMAGTSGTGFQWPALSALASGDVAWAVRRSTYVGHLG